jgi:hypothetical protein
MDQGRRYRFGQLAQPPLNLLFETRPRFVDVLRMVSPFEATDI